jgi:adenylate kinase family enzyme
MRIVLLGPQGAGKGTQAQRISRETGAKHISTGDLVRAEIKSGSELGQTIKDYNDSGDLVPDEIIVEMMKPYLDDADSWILDGFPRNESQAEALDRMLADIDAELDASSVFQAAALARPQATSTTPSTTRRQMIPTRTLDHSSSVRTTGRRRSGTASRSTMTIRSL